MCAMFESLGASRGGAVTSSVPEQVLRRMKADEDLKRSHSIVSHAEDMEQVVNNIEY